jgi:hypothetical protein
MKLSTLECSVLGCGRELQADLAMIHVLELAREQGWVVDEDACLCPEHADAESLASVRNWVVGCYTCGFEEEMTEEDARYQYKEHECEPDTYFRSPAELAKKEKDIQEYRDRRATERAQEEEQVRHSAEQALQRQHQIEKWARNWLHVRNTLVFWKKEYIHEGHIGTKARQPAREDRSGRRQR